MRKKEKFFNVSIYNNKKSILRNNGQLIKAQVSHTLTVFVCVLDCMPNISLFEQSVSLQLRVVSLSSAVIYTHSLIAFIVAQRHVVLD